jgi:hypothetical protein
LPRLYKELDDSSSSARESISEGDLKQGLLMGLLMLD